MHAGLIVVVFTLFCPSARAQKPESKFEGKPLAYWVERLQKAETKDDRNRAAQAIVTFGPDSATAVPALMEMLNDLSDDYRKLVSEILCMIGPGAKDAVPELVKRLKERQTRKPLYETENGNINEMKNLIQILGSIGPDAKNAVSLLVAALGNPDLRDEAVTALCNIGPLAKDAIPALRRLVLDLIVDLEKRSEGQPMYARSLDALSPFELHKLGPDVLPLLHEVLDVSGVLGKHFALDEILNLGPAARKAAPKLALLLQDKSAESRYDVAIALWKLEKNPACLTVLAKLLKEPGETNIPTNAARMLGEIGPDAKVAIPSLEEAVTIGFVSWYFFVSPYGIKINEFPGAGLVIPYSLSTPSLARESYLKAFYRMRIGEAAKEAILKIRPQTEQGKKSPGP